MIGFSLNWHLITYVHKDKKKQFKCATREFMNFWQQIYFQVEHMYHASYTQ